MALKAAGRQDDPKFKTALELLHAQQRLPAASAAQVQGSGSGGPPAFNVAEAGSPLGAAPLQSLGGRGEGAQLGNGPSRLAASPERREYVQGYDAALQQRQNVAANQQMIEALRRRAAQVAQNPGQGQFPGLGQQGINQQRLAQQLLRQNQGQSQGQLPGDGYGFGGAKAWGQGGAELDQQSLRKLEQQEAARKMLLQQKQNATSQEEQGGSNAHLVSQFQKLLAEKQQQQQQKMQMQQQGLNQHAYNVQRELEQRQAQRYESQKMEHMLKQQFQEQARHFGGPPAQPPFKPTPVGPLSTAALQQALKARPAAPVAVKAEVRTPVPVPPVSSRPATPPQTPDEQHPSKKFTKGQLDTLKAQILAFRRFKVRQ